MGGAIQGHPMGTTSGALAMRQAMNKPIHEEMGSLMQDKQELKKEDVKSFREDQLEMVTVGNQSGRSARQMSIYYNEYLFINIITGGDK